MKRPTLALFVLSSVLTSSDGEIVWTASGTVNGVTGTGLSATSGDAVAVKFSYQSNLLANVTDFLWFGSSSYGRTEFYGDVGLRVEVRIGQNTWRASIASRPTKGTNALLTEAWDGNGPSDAFTVLASESDGGVFDPFPYTGSTSDRKLKIVLLDGTTPAEFIQIATLPAGTAGIQHLNAGNGLVSAGTAQISFTINPASVAVRSESPRVPLTLAIADPGIELRWPSKVGVSYRLEDSGVLGDWQPLGTFQGTGSDIVVSLNPFTDHPQQRFYRVASE